MDSTQRLGIIATQAAVFALNCVLFLPIASFSRELSWQTRTMQLYLSPLAQFSCEQCPWLLLALLLIGHVAPLVIHRWRPSTDALSIQLACSAVQVVGLFTLWVLLASEITLRAMPS